MKLTIAILIAGSLSLRLYAQDRTAAAQNPEERDLIRTDSLFAEFAQEHGIAASFLAFMADSATLLPGGGNPITGRTAIGAHLRAYPPGARLLWTPVKAEVAASADLGYTRGTYEYHDRDSAGNPVIQYGKYVTLWKKQADGSWKFILDIGNKSPSPPHR